MDAMGYGFSRFQGRIETTQGMVGVLVTVFGRILPPQKKRSKKKPLRIGVFIQIPRPLINLIPSLKLT